MGRPGETAEAYENLIYSFLINVAIFVCSKFYLWNWRSRQRSASKEDVRYLPIVLRDVPVLVREGGATYRADNSQLRASVAGLTYRLSKDLTDKDHFLSHLKWGDTIEGTKEDCNWVKVVFRQEKSDKVRVEYVYLRREAKRAAFASGNINVDALARDLRGRGGRADIADVCASLGPYNEVRAVVRDNPQYFALVTVVDVDKNVVSHNYLLFLRVCRNMFLVLSLISYGLVSPLWGAVPFSLGMMGELSLINNRGEDALVRLYIMTWVYGAVALIATGLFETWVKAVRGRDDDVLRTVWLSHLPVCDGQTGKTFELHADQLERVKSNLEDALNETILDLLEHQRQQLPAAVAQQVEANVGASSQSFAGRLAGSLRLLNRMNSVPTKSRNKREKLGQVYDLTDRIKHKVLMRDEKGMDPLVNQLRKLCRMERGDDVGTFVDRIHVAVVVDKWYRLWEEVHAAADVARAYGSLVEAYVPSNRWCTLDWIKHRWHQRRHRQTVETWQRLERNFGIHKLKNKELSGSAFVTFREQEHARLLLEHHAPRCYHCRSYAFFSFGLKPFASVTLRCRPAPHPEDVAWENLHITESSRRFRYCVLTGLLVVGMVVLVTPSNLQEAIQRLLRTAKLTPDEDVFNELSNQLPTLVLLMINSVVLPAIIQVIADAVRCARKSESEMQQLCLNFWFLVLNSVVNPFLGLSSIPDLVTWLRSGHWAFINLPDLACKQIMGRGSGNPGVFSVRYLISAAFLSIAWAELQPAMYLFRRVALWCARSERERTEASLAWPFTWGYWYAYMLSLLTVGLCMSVSVPMTLPLSFCLFAFRHRVDRKNLANETFSLGSAGECIFVWRVVFYMRLAVSIMWVLMGLSFSVLLISNSEPAFLRQKGLGDRQLFAIATLPSIVGAALYIWSWIAMARSAHRHALGLPRWIGCCGRLSMLCVRAWRGLKLQMRKCAAATARALKRCMGECLSCVRSPADVWKNYSGTSERMPSLGSMKTPFLPPQEEPAEQPDDTKATSAWSSTTDVATQTTCARTWDSLPMRIQLVPNAPRGRGRIKFGRPAFLCRREGSLDMEDRVPLRRAITSNSANISECLDLALSPKYSPVGPARRRMSYSAPQYIEDQLTRARCPTDPGPPLIGSSGSSDAKNMAYSSASVGALPSVGNSAAPVGLGDVSEAPPMQGPGATQVVEGTALPPTCTQVPENVALLQGSAPAPEGAAWPPLSNQGGPAPLGGDISDAPSPQGNGAQAPAEDSWLAMEEIVCAGMGSLSSGRPHVAPAAESDDTGAHAAQAEWSSANSVELLDPACNGESAAAPEEPVGSGLEAVVLSSIEAQPNVSAVDSVSHAVEATVTSTIPSRRVSGASDFAITPRRRSIASDSNDSMCSAQGRIKSILQMPPEHELESVAAIIDPLVAPSTCAADNSRSVPWEPRSAASPRKAQNDKVACNVSSNGSASPPATNVRESERPKARVSRRPWALQRAGSAPPHDSGVQAAADGVTPATSSTRSATLPSKRVYRGRAESPIDGAAAVVDSTSPTATLPAARASTARPRKVAEQSPRRSARNPSAPRRAQNGNAATAVASEPSASASTDVERTALSKQAATVQSRSSSKPHASGQPKAPAAKRSAAQRMPHLTRPLALSSRASASHSSAPAIPNHAAASPAQSPRGATSNSLPSSTGGSGEVLNGRPKASSARGLGASAYQKATPGLSALLSNPRLRLGGERQRHTIGMRAKEVVSE